jgi:hypothetical protein
LLTVTSWHPSALRKACVTSTLSEIFNPHLSPGSEFGVVPEESRHTSGGFQLFSTALKDPLLLQMDGLVHVPALTEPDNMY